MFFRLFRRPAAPRAAAIAEPLRFGDQSVPLLLVHNPRARRYLLRIKADGTARVTIPRGGSTAQAHQFVERSRGWLEQQLQKLQSRPKPATDWRIGDEVWFRGNKLLLEAGPAGNVRVGPETIAVKDVAADLRPEVERHLRQLAARELPPRVLALAQPHGFAVRSISVRNQRSRWGSCSRRGTISLNWRLVQTPDFVRDYIILHELAHLRHLNHSRRFWQEVARICPDYQAAEGWLKTNQAARALGQKPMPEGD